MNKELKATLTELSLPENAEAIAFLKDIRITKCAEQAELRQELKAQLEALKVRRAGGGRKASSDESGGESPKHKKKKRNQE